jgi:hypothetical protein
MRNTARFEQRFPTIKNDEADDLSAICFRRSETLVGVVETDRSKRMLFVDRREIDEL